MPGLEDRLSSELHREAESLVVGGDLPDRIVERVRARQRNRHRVLVAVPVVIVAALASVGGLELSTPPRTGTSHVASARAGSTPAPSSEHGLGSLSRAGGSDNLLHAPGTERTRGKSGAVHSAAAPSGALLLMPTGAGPARIGTAKAEALAELETVLGTARSQGGGLPSQAGATNGVGIVPTPPKSGSATATPASCGIDSYASWAGFVAFFGKGSFVGYSTMRPAAQVPGGLHPGESVASARKQYGSSLRVWTVDGGSYELALPTGRIDGYVSGATARSVPPDATIATVEAGVANCPGFAP